MLIKTCGHLLGCQVKSIVKTCCIRSLLDSSITKIYIFSQFLLNGIVLTRHLMAIYAEIKKERYFHGARASRLLRGST